MKPGYLKKGVDLSSVADLIKNQTLAIFSNRCFGYCNIVCNVVYDTFEIAFLDAKKNVEGRLRE